VRPHVGAGEESEEEGTAETKCEELATTPVSCPPLLWEVRR